MIKLYFHPTPNPAKIALLLEETDLPYEVIPIDTLKGEQHTPSFRAINPNGKLPAIVDTEVVVGETRVVDSTAILLYLAEKAGRFLGAAQDRGELLSWLLFIASGLGPYSGLVVHSNAPPRRSCPMPSIATGARRSATGTFSTITMRSDFSSWATITGSPTCPPGAGSNAPSSSSGAMRTR